MKQIRFLLPLLFANLAIAQYNTTGELTEANINGLHEIRLPNEIRSFSNKDLSDFRIFDSKGKEVPYFIRKKGKLLRTNEYATFKIVSKTVLKDTSSSIIFENPFKTIKQFVLSVANYSGSKTFKLSGSNNREEWFGILNNGALSNLHDAKGISVDKTITFPQCAYRYLKIVFNDKNSLPINVLKIGSISNNAIHRALQIVTPQTKTTSELIQEKKTQIHVTFKNKEVINQIQFKVIAPEFFNRNVIIYTKSSRVVKHKTEVYNKELARFRLNSETEMIFNIPEIIEDSIYIEIENKDSNNLTFSDIRFFQKPLYIITTLNKNEHYSIKTGSKTAKAPEYDLSFFRNNISEDLPSVEIKEIVKQKTPQDLVKKESLWQKPWFMWSCIIITGLVILFFISNLVKDLKKE
ncbi:hypothetical protein [Flavivirga jejuensis]|uniref:DUF3999 family protein n=1 Tax=Flavivirga jejuensis TaxID=870487 RepID=A0ABT8WQV3_9FLAO|nr:hypothetical protein [Flavivirga jejuensis]MDO5975400.1 hypothetical protein [Flavivirga jejuensis]